MKHASLLIALCVLFGFSAMAQSTTTVEKKSQRITITTKKVDDNGNTITQTYIAEGDNPTEILTEMSGDFESLKQVEIGEPGSEGERLFVIRSAGDNQVIQGYLNETPGAPNAEHEIVIIKNGDLAIKSHTVRTRGHAGVWVNGKERDINCAALGVYVVHNGDQGGSRINSLIERGGAQAAGLKVGDVITAIEEFDVTDFGALHLALSHFKPSDLVTVRYTRENEAQKTKVELKDWAELPGHEWRSKGDCGKEEVIEDVTEDTKRDDPSFVPELQPLELQDVRMYPNPTDGVFALSFQATPGPLTIAITDIHGKAVYHERNDNSAGSYYKDIDLKGIPQGNYILSVTQGDKVYTDQISKQ